ncbi:MAG TPA: hypothetical protein VF131_05610, partial [Blastocatellia bacterium]|nr:hypothetical protein [Blastocatellia bacterium]
MSQCPVARPYKVERILNVELNRLIFPSRLMKRDVKLSADKSSGLLFSPPTFNSCRPGGAVSAVMNSKRFSYPDGRERT